MTNELPVDMMEGLIIADQEGLPEGDLERVSAELEPVIRERHRQVCATVDADATYRAGDESITGEELIRRATVEYTRHMIKDLVYLVPSSVRRCRPLSARVGRHARRHAHAAGVQGPPRAAGLAHTRAREVGG